MSTQFERYQRDKHKRKTISTYYKLLIRYIEKCMDELPLETRIKYIEFLEREQEKHNIRLEQSRENYRRKKKASDYNARLYQDKIFEHIDYTYRSVDEILERCGLNMTRSQLIHHLSALHKQGKIYRIVFYRRKKGSQGNYSREQMRYRRREYY